MSFMLHNWCDAVQMVASCLLPIWVALIWDHWWGEPLARLHPVVWMGNYLATTGTWVQRRALQDPNQRDLKAFWLGVFGFIVGSAIVLGVSWLLHSALQTLPWWASALGLGVWSRRVVT